MTEMFGEAWPPKSVLDLAPDDDDSVHNILHLVSYLRISTALSIHWFEFSSELKFYLMCYPPNCVLLLFRSGAVVYMSSSVEIGEDILKSNLYRIVSQLRASRSWPRCLVSLGPFNRS